MTSRRWIAVTLIAIVAVMTLNVAVNYCVDPYSIWHNSAGKKLVHYSSGELEAKLLLSKNYVPANFNGLILGSSSTADWEIPDIDGIRFYNESTSGSTGANEKLLVDEALKRGHFKAAVFLFSPHMVTDHEGNPEIEAFRESEALGSIFILEQDAFAAARHLGLNTTRFQTVEWNGKTVVDNPMDRKARVFPDNYFQVDPNLLEKYRELIQSLKDQGATIVYATSPVYQPCYALNEARTVDFNKSILPLLPPGPFLDFGSPEYLSLRSDPANFIDCVHATDSGGKLTSAIVAQFVQKAIDEQSEHTAAAQ